MLSEAKLASYLQWDALLSLARVAGEKILTVYNTYDTSIPFTEKEDTSPVTQADEWANSIICDGLLQLFPQTPILSEENLDALPHIHSHTPFWLIDPLDGTKGFIQKRNDFTVNIALVYAGKPLLGVVYAPAFDLMYYGTTITPSIAAHCMEGNNDTTIQVAHTVSSPIKVLASQNHLSEATQKWINQLGMVEIFRYSSSLKICRIAEGKADIYPRLAPTGIWDTAAAHAILNAAGGCIQNMEGEELCYHPQVTITNPHFVASALGMQRYVG